MINKNKTLTSILKDRTTVIRTAITGAVLVCIMTVYVYRCGGEGVPLSSLTNVGQAAGGAAPFGITTGQASSNVIGQSSFSGSNAGDPGSGQDKLYLGTAPSALLSPSNAAGYLGKLYVMDSGHNRILVFNSVPTSPGASADFNVVGTTSGPFNYPGNISIVGARLAVADTQNSIVRIFDPAPTATSTQADIEMGTLTSAGCGSGAQLNFPQGAILAPASAPSLGKLLVADTKNNRVLIWNNIPPTITNHASADISLGSGSATNNSLASCPTGTSQTLLSAPSSVWSDGTMVIVADTGNNRVLIWHTFPTAVSPGANLPDTVVGQFNFTDQNTIAGFTAESNATMNKPFSVTSDGNFLVVADSGNNRVLIWNKIPSAGANGIPADVVLGQKDFSSKLTTPVTAKTMNNPMGVSFSGSQIFVDDVGNDRVLIFP